jgi:hypothetical protein
VRRSKRISLTVPGGVEDGTRLRVAGEGNAGRRGGPPGDLYVYISVSPHPELRREGMTVFSDVSVRCFDAAIAFVVPPGCFAIESMKMFSNAHSLLHYSTMYCCHLNDDRW